MRRLARAPAAIFVLLVALVLFALAPEVGAGTRTGRLAVATEHPLATRAALEELSRGGNAVDAMIAAVLVTGVVNPTSSGLGGGGFALVLPPGRTEPTVLDFRETAPRALDQAAVDARPLPDEKRGHLVGVPGELAGLFELHRRFGTRPFAELVAPAVRAARGGFAVGTHLGRMLAGPSQAGLAKDPGFARVYFPGGRPAPAGRVIKNEKLGRTLSRIASEGPSALYQGAVAEELVRVVRDAGGSLSLDDLSSYRPRERAPLHVRFGGHDVFTMPPPSAGGLLLAETLSMFTPEELRRLGFGSGPYQHLLAEAFRAALTDRFVFVGDPDKVKVDVKALLAPARLSARRQTLSIDRTHTLPRFSGEEHGTHQLVVADGNDMVVSLTTTVNHVFGSKLVAPESGIVLNDELDDFGLPEDASELGLASDPNAPRPGARPVSSMMPTLALKDGHPVLALGGSGGMLIPSAVTELLIGRLVFGMSPEELVAARRFYVQRGDATITLDPRPSSELVRDLEYRGERIKVLSSTTNAVQMIARDAAGWRAASDPRKYGSAGVR